MGLTTPNFPAIEPGKTVMDIPYRERIKRFARHWVEYGFGGPKLFPILYVFKLLTFCITGWAVAALTTGLNPLDLSETWREPIIWQKLVVWVMLLESLGVAGAWGPLTFHFKPMTGGVLLLGPHEDAAPAAVARQGAGHGRRRAHAARRRALPRLPHLTGGVPRAARHTGLERCRGDRRQRGSDPDRAAGRGDRAERADGAPRQGHVDRGAIGAVPPGADLLRVLPVRRHGGRGEDPDRHGLDGRGGVQDRPPLRPRDPADGLEHSVDPVQGDQADALPQLPRRHPAIRTRADARPRARHGRRADHAARAAVLTEPHAHHRGGRRDDGLPPVHHLDVPARGAARMERPLHVPRGVPVPAVSRRGTAMASATWTRPCSR